MNLTLFDKFRYINITLFGNFVICKSQNRLMDYANVGVWIRDNQN